MAKSSAKLRRAPRGVVGGFRWIPLLIVLLHVHAATSLPNINPFSRGPFSRKSSTVLADNFPTENVLEKQISDTVAALDEEESPALSEVAANKLGAAAAVLYGAALLLHPNDFKAQIHTFTMMRAVGFGKLETAALRARENFRQALRAAVFRAPSLLFATQSVRHYQDRIEGRREAQRETKKAMEDGIITPAERRRINRIKRREIRSLRRDIRRVKAGASTLGRVWRALDFDEILDIFRQFFFILSTVLATGSNDGIVGKTIARWCHFLNLGQLMMDVNQRFGFPLTSLALYQELSIKDLDKAEVEVVRNVGKGLCYSLSAYLITFKRKVGFRLNMALIASSIVVRGLMTVVGWRTGVFGDFEDSLAKDEDGTVPRYVAKKRISGALIVALATVGMRHSREEGGSSLPLDVPPALLKPAAFMEDVVKKFVFIAQHVL